MLGTGETDETGETSELKHYSHLQSLIYNRFFISQMQIQELVKQFQVKMRIFHPLFVD